MKNKLFKKIMVLSMALTLAFTLSLPALAATVDVWGGGSENNSVTQDSIQGQIGLGDRDPREIIAQVINVILGFLGIIAVVIILLGGFKWMTAGGGEDKVAEAK
ncbi:MAG: hypothetical protein Q7R92_00365, partial [bacterium]|nr:hypothetical protein [bacterium]